MQRSHWTTMGRHLTVVAAVGLAIALTGCQQEAQKQAPKKDTEAKKTEAKPAKKTEEPAPRPEPKKEAKKPAPKPEPKKEDKKPAPKPEPKQEEKKPAGKPQPKKEAKKPAPKPEPKKEAKKPAPKPEPKKEDKKPAPKPKPKKEAKKPEPKKKPAPKKEASKPGPDVAKDIKPNFAKPPKSAIVLFDGKSAAEFTHYDGKPVKWQVKDGALVCTPKSGSVKSKKTFGSHKLHIEFRTPYMPEAKVGSQARGNSGVYIQGRYEVQVLDSYNIGRPIQNNDCGALYSQIKPSKNACLPPKEWQSFDITFVEPQFKDGKMTKPARLTVVQNGVTIIDNAEAKVTPGGIDKDPTKKGPLMLQDHGNTVAFRNIWVVPMK